MPPRATFRTGCPGATRTRDPRCRRAVLCSTELRDRNRSQMMQSPYWYAQEEFEPPTALQSGAHDGYKPSALPVELWAQTEKWSGWLDSNQRPPASEAGTLAGLSYTLLALRREIESLSPDRQSGRLTRCVTEREYGASGPTRTATECALNALPLPIGVQTRDTLQLEDQAGFEPAVSFRCRLKRPARSAATETGPMSSNWRTRVVTIHWPTA